MASPTSPSSVSASPGFPKIAFVRFVNPFTMNWLAPSVFSYVDVVGSVSGSRLAPILPRGIEREPRGEAGVEGRGTPRRPVLPQDRAISMEGDHDVCIDQKSRAGRAVVGLGGRRRVEEEEEEGQMRRVGGGGGWEVFGAMLGFRKDLRKQRRRDEER